MRRYLRLLIGLRSLWCDVVWEFKLKISESMLGEHSHAHLYKI
ncbi:hypothetical protein PEC301899_40460 [Pectobacterium carotovorum subsp. carotovorum]|nr:hypothetical protein PEC301899_40460 [Pectobacterium carotovorum subsp. carotovorum]